MARHYSKKPVDDQDEDPAAAAHGGVAASPGDDGVEEVPVRPVPSGMAALGAKAALTPGGSAEAARQAAPADFIKAKIPVQYGSSTIYGRGGKTSVHIGGEVVEMTRAQAERIGAVEVKAKARTEPAPSESAEEAGPDDDE